LLKRYLPILLFLLLLMGCDRESFDLEKASLYPMVVATHSQKGDSFLTEGVALTLLGSSFDSEKEYQFSLKSPQENYVWERMVYPFEASGLLYLGSNDLLLPPEETLEEGIWSVELFLPDGRQRGQEIEFSPSRRTIDGALLAVSMLPPLEWELSDRGWSFNLYAGEWRYTLYGPTPAKSFKSKFTVDEKVKEETALAVALRYDEAANLYYVVRTIFY
jgi:hypothetical protein